MGSTRKYVRESQRRDARAPWARDSDRGQGVSYRRTLSDRPRASLCQFPVLHFLCLATVLAVLKSQMLLMDIQKGRADACGILHLAGRLIFAVHEEIAFALVLSGALYGCSVLLRRRVILRRTLNCLAVLLSILFVAFEVGTVKLWEEAGRYLTWRLLYAAGGLSGLDLTLTTVIPYGSMLCFALAPVAIPFVLLKLRGVAGQAVGCVCGLLTCPWLLLRSVSAVGGAHLLNPHPEFQQYQAPQWALIYSFYRQRVGLGSRVVVPDVYYRDFDASVGERLEDPAAVNAIPTEHARRNVLLIVLESVGSRYLSVYGSPHHVTPNLERLAADGTVFTDFYANSTSSADSLVAMTCSLYPRGDLKLAVQETPQLAIEDLPRVFLNSGYRTACFGPIICSRGHTEFIESLGFQFLGTHAALGLDSNWESWDDLDLADHTLRWINEERDRSFFAVIWTSQTHYPYPVHGEERGIVSGNPALNRYLNNLSRSDTMLGRLMAGLQSLELDESTLIVVTGDHGESFGSHGLWARGLLYEESVRVPLIIRDPDGRRPGVKREALGQHIDLAPTVAALCGLECPPGWQGKDLNVESSDRVYFLSYWEDYLMGLREGQYKYITKGNFASEEMYDLSRDPMEAVELTRSTDSLRLVFRQRLVAWHRSQPKLIDSLATRQRAALVVRAKSSGARGQVED